MVDFQERTTRRDFGSDADGDATDADGDATDVDGTGGDDPVGGGHAETDHHADDIDRLGVAVITVSSSRTLDADPGGDRAVALLEEADHDVVLRELVDDDHDRVQRTVDRAVGREDVDAVVTAGGTGVTPDDVTVEAVGPLFEKELPGFGELFRRRSTDEVGTRVVGSRATAGIADGVPVFCLPGSENAVQLGISVIVIPEAGHLAGLAGRT